MLVFLCLKIVKWFKSLFSDVYLPTYFENLIYLVCHTLRKMRKLPPGCEESTVIAERQILLDEYAGHSWLAPSSVCCKGLPHHVLSLVVVVQLILVLTYFFFNLWFRIIRKLILQGEFQNLFQIIFLYSNDYFETYHDKHKITKFWMTSFLYFKR